tara:strand:- start:393 stop:551 length:159 start_codon:yes stop_codon:yes gene_type:complete
MIPERIDQLNLETNEGEDDNCGFCGKSWNSEYHINDECTNINEDQDKEDIRK